MAKATEFDKLRKSRRRKRMFRRIVAGLIFLVFLGVCFISSSFVYQLDLGSRLDNLRASLEGGDGFPVSMSDLTILNLLPMDGDVAVVTTAGTYLYNSNGALTATCLNDFRTPQAKSAGGKLLTYDLGGTGLRVDNKRRELWAEEAEGGTLLAADIGENGAVAVAQTIAGSYAQVTAYNPRFELMYSWRVPDSYITGVSLSRDGTMMSCAGVGMEGQHVVGLLRIHHFDRDEEVARISFPDQVVVSMVWTGEEEIQVVTDKALYLYSKEGEQLAMAELPGQMVTFENVPGNLYVAYGDYRDLEGVTILAYSGDLEQVGEASVDRKVLSLTADGHHLLVLTEGQLYLGDPSLRELKARDHQGLYWVCLAGSSLYGITPDGLVREGL